ncbi:uncharacterized protein V6R79_015924 [Siganus canaliculatus]
MEPSSFHLLDPMQATSTAPRVPDPDPDPETLSEGLRRAQPDNGFLEKLAQNMSETIIQSLLSQMDAAHQMSRSDHGLEMFAEQLASAVLHSALSEVVSGQNSEDHQESLLISKMESQLRFINQPESNGHDSEMDTDMDPGKEVQTSKDAQARLSQSGLPVMGSLDYPDAPPSTPLLPELEQSRRSFARKLKGGLAKVFLPSPPPPTPKDREQDSEREADNHGAELMEHLREYFEVEPHPGAKMEAFAEALSCDIIDWVLGATNKEEVADDDGGLHRLAHQLAQTIIISSLDEAKMFT